MSRNLCETEERDARDVNRPRKMWPLREKALLFWSAPQVRYVSVHVNLTAQVSQSAFVPGFLAFGKTCKQNEHVNNNNNADHSGNFQIHRLFSITSFSKFILSRVDRFPSFRQLSIWNSFCVDAIRKVRRISFKFVYQNVSSQRSNLENRSMSLTLALQQYSLLLLEVGFDCILLLLSVD